MPESVAPRLDKTIDVLELAPERLTEIHTKIHVIFSGIEKGKYFENWTLEDCERIHKMVIKRMTEEGIEHIETKSVLDKKLSKLDEINNFLEFMRLKEEKKRLEKIKIEQNKEIKNLEREILLQAKEELKNEDVIPSYIG